MASYLYFCPDHGEFEVWHSITEKLEVCPKCEEEGKDAPCKVERLIAGGTSFQLVGSGWARDNYS